MTICIAKIKNGNACTRSTVQGTSFCWQHTSHNENNDEKEKREKMALEELKIVETIINAQEQIRLKISGWGVATVSAISVAFLSKKLGLPPDSYLILSIIILAIFLWLDTVHRVAVDRAIQRSNYIESVLRGEVAYDGPRIGESISVSNGIPYQLKSLKNVRVYAPYLALSFAVIFIYAFNIA